MINKIERIYNIGNFENYDASGNVSLGKMSLIYAINGAGKTTLARIFQSLSTGDGSIITRHRRIGATGDPSVIMISDATRYKFRNGAWDGTTPEVAVFDSHFVANNVYSGFEITSDHHKCLYQFVVGDAGVEIIKKIERVKNLLSICNAKAGEKAELIRIATKTQDVDKICALDPKENVDELITAKETELKLAQGQAQIMSLALPKEIQASGIVLDYDTAKTVLALTMDGIEKEYLDMVQAHLQHLKDAGIKDGSDWVFKGTREIENCPYCGRPLEGVELVKGYTQYFSERYRDAVSKAEALKAQVERINIEHYVLGLTTQYELLKNAQKEWDALIPGQPPLPSFEIGPLGLEEKFQKIKASIGSKATNPVEAISTAELDTFMAAMATLDRLVNAVNDYVKAYLVKVTELKSKIRPLADVERDLKVLQIFKARYEEPLSGYCAQYQLLLHQGERLQRINKELQSQQKAASNLLFSQYGAKINDYLRNVFKTPFQISDVKDGGFKGTSRRPNLDYTLSFNGTPINQDDGMQNTSFKNVLSEGDKNTIAFSFFLAKLTSDPHYADKIVVFDDPLTSLDMNRRNATIGLLVKLYGDCKQVIVLSHNLHFLVDLNTRKRISRNDKVGLQIVNRNGKSSIEEYVIKSEWIDRYKKAILAMTDFENNPDPAKQDEAVNAIRISLETFLKLKFCQYIPDFNLTFGKLIDRLKQTPCTFVNPDKDSVIERLMDLDEISWKTHHGTVDEMDVYHEVDLTPAEAKNYVRDTLNMLEKEL
jgi:wobble nucleotide-excising tRNase